LTGAAPILSREGERLGAVVAMQDISAAEQLERLRAEWSSVIAHDLRQPLNSMMLAAQFCARPDLEAAAKCEYAQRVLAGGRRLDRMIHDLMDLSQLEASRLRLRRAPCDLVAIVRASAAETALDPANPPIQVHVRDAIPPVDGDADRLMQVMANLLSNAVKYGRRGAEIDVDVARAPEHVTVAVTNRGEGIAPEDLPRLFQRFERVAKRPAVKGIGLGLHITRGLVEAHGGNIEVTSSPGATTTFRFTIPLATPPRR
jgi:signal transduction histidine kinase